jgi:hypothetical protein
VRANGVARGDLLRADAARELDRAESAEAHFAR